MIVKYVPNGSTKVVIDKKTYQNEGEKYAVLPVDKLSEDEIAFLLKKKFIKKLELDDSGASASPVASPASNPSTSTGKNSKQKNKPGNNQPPDVKPREELLKEAQEAGVTVTDEMTDEEIQKLIAEAKGAQV